MEENAFYPDRISFTDIRKDKTIVLLMNKKETLENVEDPETIVAPSKITVIFEYPFRKKYYMTFVSRDKIGFYKAELARALFDTFQELKVKNYEYHEDLYLVCIKRISVGKALKAYSRADFDRREGDILKLSEEGQRILYETAFNFQ